VSPDTPLDCRVFELTNAKVCEFAPSTMKQSRSVVKDESSLCLVRRTEKV
jgi:hypothetical protein